jgi:type I restriction enzyme, S subunit
MSLSFLNNLTIWRNLPQDWRPIHLKYIARLAYGDSLPSDQREEGNIPVFGSNGIVGYHNLANTLAPTIVIGRKGSFGKIAYYEQAGFAIDTTYLIDYRYTKEHLRWLYYALQTLGLDAFSQDTGIPGLAREKAYEFYLNVPPCNLQKAIASFLDRKTAAIDTLIIKKQRLIQLLEEKRTALINQAVTKGLNPNISMIDSCIPWIGKIPKHWHIVKISLKSRLLNGTTPDRTRLSYWEEGTIPWVCSGEVNEYIITKPTTFITEIALRECSLTIMPKQSVVIGMIGQGKTCGTSAKLGINACINQNVACIMPSADLDSIYLHQALIQAYEPIRELARGGNQGALNCELVGSIKIPFPPIEEQRKIAVFLEGKYQALEEIKKAINSQIQKLQEYRQSLITAAVTGKIDMREEVAA